MNNIAIFCGSSSGNDPKFKETSITLGQELALKNKTIIYGGAKIGLMGCVADGALSRQGTVIGVIPTFLKQKEIVHENLTTLIEVNTMHERKLKMHELSDAVITLPGGYGTLEELFEMLTWAQINLHNNPIGILNIKGYFNPIIAMIDQMINNDFLHYSFKNLLIINNNVNNLLFDMGIK